VNGRGEALKANDRFSNGLARGLVKKPIVINFTIGFLVKGGAIDLVSDLNKSNVRMRCIVSLKA
jgi:hypothetical protein